MPNIKALEHSTLIVPYEQLNKKFRATQKTIEREFNRVGCVVGELELILAKPTVRIQDMNGAVGNLLEKLTTLKRKASEAIEEECSAANLLKKRLSHLKVATVASSDAKTMELWEQNRIDRCLVDYLLRSGYYDTAMNLAAHNEMSYLCNAEVFLKAREVEKTLAIGDTSKWCEWALDNKSKLRRLKSGLELKIRRQEFIELIRQGKRLEAVKFARKHFAELSPDQWPALTPTLGLLAIEGPQTKIPRYKDMFAADSWKTLVEEFKSENLRIHHLNHSVFSALLQCGLSAMKTPRCVAAVKQRRAAARAADDAVVENGTVAAGSFAFGPTSRAAVCPLCSGDAGDLAATLPSAHSSQSKLICAYSGEPVNDANPPLMLPNGRVYGQNSLLAIAAENQGKIVCPRTKKIYDLKDAERVFVM